MIFGPDANGDGRQDLYVSNNRSTGLGQDKGSHGNIKRFDGVSGAFIDTFVPFASGGLNHPAGMTFTETDPMTLAYVGADLSGATAIEICFADLSAALLGQAGPHIIWIDPNAAIVRRTKLEHDDHWLVDQVLRQGDDHRADAWLGAWLHEQFDSAQGRARRRR